MTSVSSLAGGSVEADDRLNRENWAARPIKGVKYLPLVVAVDFPRSLR